VSRASLLLIGSCVLGLGCRSPTEVTLVLSTNVDCSQFQGLSIYAGLDPMPSNAAGGAPITTTSGCGGASAGPGNLTQLGTFVLAPSGSESAPVTAVIIGANTPGTLADCVSAYPTTGPKCIVASRSLAFVPHTPLQLPIELSAACEGVTCGSGDTCQSGSCVSNMTTFDGGVGMIPEGGIVDAEADAAKDATKDSTKDSTADSGAPGTAYLAADGGIMDAANWTQIPLPAAAMGQGYQGGTFDGLNVYLAPSGGSTGGGGGLVFLKYDTSPDAATPWTTRLNSFGAGVTFSGAVYDKPYVYYVPASGAPEPTLARYDTTTGWFDSSSWSLSQVTSTTASGFRGGVLAPPNIYLAPHSGVEPVPRYDPVTSSFEAGVWETATNSNIASNSAYWGAVADIEGFVYFVPNAQVTTGVNVIRYSTTSGFTVSTSWASYNLPAPTQPTYKGGAFDGRYLYLAPASTQSPLFQYDTSTKDSFPDSGSAWKSFAIDLVPTTDGGATPGPFFGAAFDGRYVYFVPANGETTTRQTLALYDTQCPSAICTGFICPNCWASFTILDVGATSGFAGAVFDGEYVYFIPADGGAMARFHARVPRATYGTFTPSFY
jgi:hypothetical protein